MPEPLAPICASVYDGAMSDDSRPMGYRIYDGGGAATCRGCGGRCQHTWRALDERGEKVSICSSCASLPVTTDA